MRFIPRGKNLQKINYAAPKKPLEMYHEIEISKYQDIPKYFDIYLIFRVCIKRIYTAFEQGYLILAVLFNFTI